jgi:LacI family transcriptional regulator
MHEVQRVRSATIKDVAARAGVSLKTVSRVVNNEPSVRPRTRDKVQREIDALGYQPDPFARSLRSTRTYALGLVYDNPNAHYIINLQRGVLSVCRASGFGLQIHPCNASSPVLADELCELVRRSRLAGLILAPPMSEQPELIRRLAAAKIPFMRIISARQDPQDGHPCVYVDDRDAAYAITEHLIQLGHQRIGFLWGGRDHRSSIERHQGYEDALRDYGVALDRKLVVQGDFTFDDGFRGARKLLALKDRPTAIFGSNDEIAAGVLAAAHSDGINVPYELSIAGFEDSPFSKQSWPALTTARQATEEIARHAAQQLIANLEHAARGEPVGLANEGFSPELVVRDSTAPPRGGAHKR